MTEHKPIRLTKAQRDRLFEYGVGVGIVAYKMADHQLSEFEFYIDRKNQMRFVGNGAPIQFEIERDEDGFETCAKVVEYDGELQARADILNRAVEHRKRLFPDDIGNGWVDSIDRLAGEIERLRRELGWYADGSNYRRAITQFFACAVIDDDGQRARAALKDTEGKP